MYDSEAAVNQRGLVGDQQHPPQSVLYFCYVPIAMNYELKRT